MIEIALPFPPSLNHAWRRVHGKTVLAKSHRKYRDAVLAALALALDTDQPLATLEFPLFGRLAVSLRFFPGTKQRWDLDGKPKAVLDALTKAGVWGDDEQIDCLMLYREGVDKKQPRVVVKIWIYHQGSNL